MSKKIRKIIRKKIEELVGDEFPDFFDRQGETMFKGEPYPPTMYGVNISEDSTENNSRRKESEPILPCKE